MRDVLKIGIRYGRLGPGHFGRFWPNPLDALHLRSPATCVHRSGGLGSKPTQTVSGPIFRTSLYNYGFYGIRFNQPEGSTLTIPEGRNMNLINMNNINNTALLMTPQSGDVTLRGGTIRHTGYHFPVSFLNYNSNATLRVESKILNQINLQADSYGPGTVVFANDNNDFDGTVGAYDGSTLEFTSVTPAGSNSALGKGNYNNQKSFIIMGQDATLRYIGSTEEGHFTDRPIHLAGDGALDASGVGPLHFTSESRVFVNEKLDQAYIQSFDLTLTGSGEGIFDGAINLGYWGALRKTGSGRWAIRSMNSNFYYPTTLEEGTLALDGATPIWEYLGLRIKHFGKIEQ